VPQGSVLSPTLYSLYTNDTPETLRVYLALFADDTCLYSTDREEGYVLRKLQRCLTAMESRCERWNIKINGEKAQANYFSHRRTSGNFSYIERKANTYANHVKYLGVILDKKITWKVHTETIPIAALRMFLSIYPILKIERLSVGAKLIVYKALIRFMLTYACPVCEFAADSHLLKLQQLQNRALRTIGNLPRHTLVRDLHRSFKVSIFI
jgi:hypothetical protein